MFFGKKSCRVVSSMGLIITQDAYAIVASERWRRHGPPAYVLTHRHGALVLEDFLPDDPSQKWFLTRNNGLFTNVGGSKRFLEHDEACDSVLFRTAQTQSGWAFETMGEHPNKYMIIPRACPEKSIASMQESRSVTMKTRGFIDDNVGWYIVRSEDLAKNAPPKDSTRS